MTRYLAGVLTRDRGRRAAGCVRIAQPARRSVVRSGSGARLNHGVQPALTNHGVCAGARGTRRCRCRRRDR